MRGQYVFSTRVRCVEMERYLEIEIEKDVRA